MKTLFIPVAIAFCAFYLITGFEPLDAKNISWLGKGEPLTPYLGWEIFRNSPWENPLGLNPRYGLEEVSSAIVFSDSIPLLAIFFKALNPILPPTFQYFGVWLLLAFILQATFAFKITSLITKSIYIQICAAIFALFMPAMLYRINVHIPLAGHFLILWGIYLNLRKENRTSSWMLLVFFSLGIQFYLFVMVMVLWSANLFDKAKELGKKSLLINFSLTIAIVLLAGWQFGYFVIPSGISAGQGYGIYQANVLSFINPIDWSSFKSNNLYTPRNHEGNNYVGMGVICLIISALLCLFFKDTRNTFIKNFKQHFFLAIALIGLSIFAFSNSIDIGKNNLLIPIPELAVSILSTIRASGRMLWPIMYASLFISIWLIYISVPKKIFLVLITIFTAIQVMDTRKGWIGLHDYFSEFHGTEISTSLNNNFWNHLPKNYSSIRLVPPQNWYHRWADIATYAAKNNIATSLVYLSRTDSTKLERVKKKLEADLVNGSLDPNTIYIFQKWTDNLDQPDPTYDSKKDLFARIDSTTLLIPGYKKCLVCEQVDPALEIQSLIPKVEINKPILFSKNGEGLEFLLNGWAWPESWGIWSYGMNSTLAIPLGNSLPTEIRLNFRALLGPSHPHSTVEIYLNGELQEKIRITHATDNSLLLSIPSKLRANKFITLELRYLDPSSPKKAGIGSQDDRMLTIGLESLVLLK